MRRTRRNERGYALLLVFAMAAAAAVMLYLEMPRVAFEHQRDKEGLLVERGEQYVRAIRLFVKRTNKWPQTLDDLETTNNMRFLRRRYKDPMTGEDEWRLIHTDGMQLTDSLVQKRSDQQKQSGPSILASTIQGIGESATYINQPGQGISPALLKRASDRISPGAPGGPNLGTVEAQPPGEGEARSGPPDQGAQLMQPPGPPQPPGQYNPQQPTAVPPQPGTPPTQIPGNPFAPFAQQGQQGQPGQLGQQRPPGYPTQPVSSQQGSMIGQPIMIQPGMQGQGQQGQQQSGQSTSSFGFGGAFVQSQPQPQGQPSRTAGPFGGVQGQAGFGGTGFPSQSSNPALDAIRNQLSSPRPGGAPVGSSMTPTGTPMGGGIAGVASKKDLEGILVYNERTNYKEWEFIYDQKKELAAQGLGGGAAPGTMRPGQPGQQGQPGQPGQPGMTGGPSPFTFGNTGGSNQPRPAPGGGFGFGGGGFGVTPPKR